MSCPGVLSILAHLLQLHLPVFPETSPNSRLLLRQTTWTNNPGIGSYVALKQLFEFLHWTRMEPLDPCSSMEHLETFIHTGKHGSDWEYYMGSLSCTVVEDKFHVLLCLDKRAAVRIRKLTNVGLAGDVFHNIPSNVLLSYKLAWCCLPNVDSSPLFHTRSMRG